MATVNPQNEARGVLPHLERHFWNGHVHAVEAVVYKRVVWWFGSGE